MEHKEGKCKCDWETADYIRLRSIRKSQHLLDKYKVGDYCTRLRSIRKSQLGEIRHHT